MTSQGNKILRLQHPFTLRREDAAEFGLWPPLGLAYLGAVLVQDGYDVEIRDLVAEGQGRTEDVEGGMVRLGLPQREVETLLRERSPRIVGISNNFTAFRADAMQLARLVRECLPDAMIVLGGAHASMDPELLLNTGNVDAVVLGEGEFIFQDLVKAVCAGQLEQARQIQGTSWRVNGRIVHNGVRDPIPNLDSIPFPAYRLLSMERYIWQRKANFAAVMRRPVGHMITSRGCRYNCIFCSTKKHFRRLRTRTPANVLAEMKLLIGTMGFGNFTFTTTT